MVSRDIQYSIICISLIFNPIVQVVGMYRVCQFNKTTVQNYSLEVSIEDICVLMPYL